MERRPRSRHWLIQRPLRPTVYEFMALRGDLLAGIAAMGLSADQPVLSDMGMFSANSGILSETNSAANLTREANEIPTRIGINSATGFTGLVWKSFAGDGHQPWRNSQLALAAAYFGVGAYYAAYDNDE